MIFLLFSLFLEEIPYVEIPNHYRMVVSHNGLYDSVKCSIHDQDFRHEDENQKLFKEAINDTNNVNFSLLDALSNRNFLPALSTLGDFYFYGIPPIQQNFTKAREYYERSISNKGDYAFSQLAFMYFYGLGVKKNTAKAAIYHHIGTKVASLHSILWETFGYAYGGDKPKSIYRALKNLFRFRMFSTGEVFYYDNEYSLLTRSMKLPKEEIESFNKKKIDYLKLASDFGDEGASVSLGMYYYSGLNGLPENKTEAYKYLERAPNNSKSLIFRGRMHHFGEGDIPQDIQLSKELYQKAAEQQASDAYDLLGVMAEQENKIEEAHGYFNESAKLGNIPGTYNKGIFEQKKHGECEEAYKDFSKVSREFEPALHKVVTYIQYGFAPYNITYLFENYSLLLRNGKWNKIISIAENYYRSQNYYAATLLWMQLSDMGNYESSFNAGLAILNWNKISPDNDFFGKSDYERGKLAAKFFKRAQLYSGGKLETVPYIYESYILMNRPEEAFEYLLSSPNILEVSYLLVKESCLNHITFYLSYVFNYITLAIKYSAHMLLPLIALMPLIIYQYLLLLLKFLIGVLNSEQLLDFIQFHYNVYSQLKGYILIIFSVIPLISLIKRRIRYIA